MNAKAKAEKRGIIFNWRATAGAKFDDIVIMIFGEKPVKFLPTVETCVWYDLDSGREYEWRIILFNKGKPVEGMSGKVIVK